MLASRLRHVSYIVDTKRKLKTTDGTDVSVLELQHTDDKAILSAWATHFRNHYCKDSQIDRLRKGTGKNRSDYLKDLKFPANSKGFGPGTRSGDFTEILVADYLEFTLQHWIPNRWKYSCKDIRNESKKGCDVLGIYLSDTGKPLDDILDIYEVKSDFSKTKANRMQNAVDSSKDDNLKKAETLNAAKQYFIEKNDDDSAVKIERFQNINDYPYTEKYGAVVVVDSSLYNEDVIEKTDVSNHPNRKILSLLVIKGDNMKKLVNDLYERAADEA